MQIHELKTWPNYFEDLLSGIKTFELRYNDRNFQVGDIVVCNEYLPKTNKYTGRSLRFEIKYLINCDFDEITVMMLKPNCCILGISHI